MRVARAGEGGAGGGGYLAEVPEAEATGSVAEIYADIRRVLGLPIVNLVYRHLAASPGLLEATWAALRPNLTSAAAEAAAAELASRARPPEIAPIPRAALGAAAFAPDEAGLAAATLGAYARANSRNVLGMHSLLDGCLGTGEKAAPVEPPAPAPVLFMADLRSLPPSAAALLDEMSLAVVGAAEPRIVPSLLRHFAHNPCLLALLWTAVRPAVSAGALSARAQAVAVRARALAGELPHPVTPLADEETRAVARRFADAMSTLLVLGEMLRSALAEALESA